MQPSYRKIVAHIESCFEQKGDTPQGFDWRKPNEMPARFETMLGVIRPEDRQNVSLLDFGCGGAHLYEYMQDHGWAQADYVGVDISERFIELCRGKYPDLTFLCGDALDGTCVLPEVDYVVANGIFTMKLDMSFDDMFAYMQRLVPVLFASARKGLAFNVMSAHVDWQRDDLFHLPFDALATYLRAEVSRHFQFRQDYGLYEYTAYVYREPLLMLE